MGLVKNLLYAIYDVNDDLVGIYESVEEVVINYYKVDPDNPLFEIKKICSSSCLSHKNNHIHKALKFIVIRRNKNGIKTLFLVKGISKKYKDDEIISKLETIRKELEDDGC
ncbi:hypothetical protein [Spiroplasma sp. SV19]|uniref:hypothetical protein n=1 Tax=Spiroplasma sp. SV19 TaxID=2570468 RepID=UPI0024B7B2E4|nr:hypothetical protein [Spiroplasma sp. SV19]WHQ36783.1 hypothetical protein E7Y35_02610 [Spiroplasma sp. SV19]